MRPTSEVDGKESVVVGHEEKALFLGFWSVTDGWAYTRAVEHVSKEELMENIKKKTRKGSVYYTDTFRSYNSFKRLWKRHCINNSRALAYGGKNHINCIGGFLEFC